MPLLSTNLVISGSPLDPAFRGTLQQFFDHMLERMKIVAPFGVSTFVTGSQAPTSDAGPWLKDGTQWWVWSDSEKTYVPLDITASLTNQFAIQPNEPADTEILFWAQTDSVNGAVINFWVRSGGVFYPVFITAGSTASRPAAPFERQRYFDTDIHADIMWERGAWRTVAGVPGDVKFVVHTALTEAIRYNPGWVEVGSSSIGSAARGRVFSSAHKDAGGVPATSFPALAGITQRAAAETFGEEDHVLTEAELAAHAHFLFNDYINGALFVGISGSQSADKEASAGGTTNLEYRMSGSDPVAEPPVNGISSETGDGDGHNTIQPTMALWCLVKQ